LLLFKLQQMTPAVFQCRTKFPPQEAENSVWYTRAGGGPLQMLLTLTLNLLPASPKIRPLGQHSAPFRKGKKVNHLYRKFGPFEAFLLKNLEKFD
jgi:hypothetical protein